MENSIMGTKEELEKVNQLLKEYEVRLWSFDKIDERHWILLTDKKVTTAFRVLFTNIFPERNIGFEVIEKKLTYHEISDVSGIAKHIAFESFQRQAEETDPVVKEIDEMRTKYNKDLVNHPSHYNSGKIEVIEAIEDWQLNYPRGNAVKYIARAGKKDPAKEVEDLEKAVWYIRRDIEKLKSKLEGREALRPNEMGTK